MHQQTLAHPTTGDVIEVNLEGKTRTAIVLLSNADLSILDFCDDQVPQVMETVDLRDARIFRPLSIAA